MLPADDAIAMPRIVAMRKKRSRTKLEFNPNFSLMVSCHSSRKTIRKPCLNGLNAKTQ